VFKSYQILRLCNVVGNDPRANSQKNALEMILTKIVKNEPVQVYQGDNYRDFLHVDDVCRAINLCINKGPVNGVINIGRGESYRIIDLVEYAKQKVKSSSKIEIIPAPPFHKVVQVENFFMDTAALNTLGFIPSLSISETVDKILANIQNGTS
jgi:dTDP-glucose 4,6-dehydratase